MSSRIKRNAHILNALSKSKPTIRKDIIKRAPDEVIDCISEVCHNLLRCNIPVSSRYKKQLSKKKKAIRLVANKKISHKHKRKTLQTGGFLNLLAPLLKTVIAPLASTLLGGFAN